MLKNWQFYPLALMTIFGMIAYALSYGDHEPIDPSQGYLLEGRGLETLTTGPGTFYDLVGDPVNPYAYTTLSANQSLAAAPQSAGVFATLSREYKTEFAGKDIEIIVTARAGQTNPVSEFKISYFATGAGDTGWKDFIAGKEFQEFKLVYTPKKATSDFDVDYLGIWPDVKGESKTLDVKSLRVRILN